MTSRHLRYLAFAVLLLPRQADAGQIVQTQSYGPSPVNDGTALMTFNKYQGAEQLISVQVIVQGGVTVSVNGINEFGLPGTMTVTLDLFGLLGSSDTPAMIGEFDLISGPKVLGTGHFLELILEYHFGPFADTGTSDQIFTASDALASFIGTGSFTYSANAGIRETHDIPLTTKPAIDVTSLGVMSIIYNTQTAAAVPEPMTLGSLLLGILAGVSGYRRIPRSRSA